MHAAHAAAAGYKAVVFTSVGSFIFVLRLFYYCMVMDSITDGLVGGMFSAIQGRVNSSRLPPSADCCSCLTRTPWDQTSYQLQAAIWRRRLQSCPHWPFASWSWTSWNGRGALQPNQQMDEWRTRLFSSSWVSLLFLCKILQAIQLYLPWLVLTSDISISISIGIICASEDGNDISIRIENIKTLHSSYAHAYVATVSSEDMLSLA